MCLSMLSRLNVAPDYLIQGVRLITNIWAAAETETQIEDVELTSAIELAFTTTDEQASSNAPRPKDKIHPTS